MERYAPVAKDLASRDVVSRSMTIEIREGRYVLNSVHGVFQNCIKSKNMQISRYKINRKYYHYLSLYLTSRHFIAHRIL